MPGIKSLLPKTPNMFNLLEMTYDAKDAGFYEKKPLKLRATAHQIACWEMAIELTSKIKKLEDRRLIWGRAMRFSWVALAKKYGVHRITIKRKHKTILLNLESSLVKKDIDRIDRIIV